MGKELIRTFSGEIIGSIETESNGDKTVRNFSQVVLGYYRKSQNMTTDFSGRCLYQGDMASALLVLKN